MVKSKNIIAGLGVVAGLGMALMPLGAFATGETGVAANSDAVSHTIRGVVADYITLTVADGRTTLSDGSTKVDLVSLEAGKVNNSLVHTVTVNTNAQGGYSLKMFAADSKTALRYVTAYDTTNKDVSTAWSDDITIPSVASETTLTNGGTAGWGYKIRTGTEGNYDSTGFLPIPANEAAGVIKTVAKKAAADTVPYEDTYNVNFGILPASNQRSGAYEATVTYKATTNLL